jgi:hypothetical protein
MIPPLQRVAVPLFAAFLALSTAHADVPVLIFAGQSNMGGFQTNTHQLSPDELAEQPNVLFYGDTKTWQTVDLATRPTQPDDVLSGSGFGPEATVGKDLVAAGVFPKVLEIKYMRNGSPNDSFLASPDDAVKTHAPNPVNSTWAPDFHVTGSQVSLYQNLLQRVKEARAAYTAQTGQQTYIAGFFWMQGETDAFSSAGLAKMYDQNLVKFIAALRRDLDTPDMPFIYGRIRHGKAFANDLIVRNGEDNIAKMDSDELVPHVFEVDTDAYEMASDGVHYSSAGAMSLGHDMAKGFQEIAGKK